MTNNETLAFRLADIAALAQAQFQQKHSHIDPVIGINQQMRQHGFAVDLLTIDCAVHKNRITFLVEDDSPEYVKYQFAKTNEDPPNDFDTILVSELDQQKFFEFMDSWLPKQSTD